MDDTRFNRWITFPLTLLFLGFMFFGGPILLFKLLGDYINAPQRQREQAEIARQQQEQRDQATRWCALLKEAQDAAATSGRPDLAGDVNGTSYDVEACHRPSWVGCAYTVDLILTLESESMLDLLNKIQELGLTSSCRKEMKFAKDHGMAALKEHLEIMQEAIEEERRR